MTLSRQNADRVQENSGIVASWKSIAEYFGYNVRTVRRWEQERGLPVHRVPGKNGGAVFAYRAELDAWLISRAAEPGPGPAELISGTASRIGSVAENESRSPDIAPLAGASADERQVKQVPLRRWQMWAFAASTLLIVFALFWMVRNHWTVSATAFTQLGPTKAGQHVAAPGAEELYLRGRYYWNLRTADCLAKAIDLYTQAIVKDPSYAEAYAGLAETYDLLPQYGQADLGESLTKAKNAADRAIALNPNLAAAHSAKAFALFFWDWDIAGSDAEFRRALALDPNSADTHQWYASTLQCRNEGTEAIKQIDAAVRLRPTSASIAADAAYFHADFGDFDQGVAELEQIERTQQTLSSPAWFLRELYFRGGDFPAYIAEARQYASITGAPDDIALAEAVKSGWDKAGRSGLLEARAKALKIAFDRGTDAGFDLGETLLLLGHPKEALPYFKASFERHSILLITMHECPWATSLSSDPGYAALLAQVHKRLHGGRPGPVPVRVSILLPQ